MKKAEINAEFLYDQFVAPSMLLQRIRDVFEKPFYRCVNKVKNKKELFL